MAWPTFLAAIKSQIRSRVESPTLTDPVNLRYSLDIPATVVSFQRTIAAAGVSVRLSGIVVVIVPSIRWAPSIGRVKVSAFHHVYVVQSVVIISCTATLPVRRNSSLMPRKSSDCSSESGINLTGVSGVSRLAKILPTTV